MIELIWKIYIIKEAFPISYLIKSINKNKFAKTSLNANLEIFVTHIYKLAAKIRIHLTRKSQISFLLVEKVTISIK